MTDSYPFHKFGINSREIFRQDAFYRWMDGPMDDGDDDGRPPQHWP